MIMSLKILLLLPQNTHRDKYQNRVPIALLGYQMIVKRQAFLIISLFIPSSYAYA